MRDVEKIPMTRSPHFLMGTLRAVKTTKGILPIFLLLQSATHAQRTARSTRGRNNFPPFSSMHNEINHVTNQVFGSRGTLEKKIGRMIFLSAVFLLRGKSGFFDAPPLSSERRI